MSDPVTPRMANGRRDPVLRFAAVINSNIQRQLEARAALRETGLFSLTLSCESAETARDVLEGNGEQELSLILLDASLAGQCLPLMSATQRDRTILTHEPDIDLEYDMLAVPHPVSAAVLLDVIERMGDAD